MNKNLLKSNKRYLKLGLTLFLVIVLSIIFYRSSESFNLIIVLKKTTSVLTPFIYGILVAYILNPILKGVENLIGKIDIIKSKKPLKRTLSITLTYILLIGFLFGIISYIIPEIIENGQNIITFIKEFNVNSLISTINISLPETILTELKTYLSTLLSLIVNIPSKLGYFLLNTASSIINFILGLVISIYILSDKENLAYQCKKISYVFFGKKFSDKLIEICYNSNKIFEKYFVGKVIDSTIIGVIFFIGASLLSAPFSAFLSLIIAITNMIPYFGPFIGGIPVVLITLISEIDAPLKSLWIAIFILALQQFDGVILGPKILGDSIGLKPLWIILSVTVGGAIFGVLGMFFGAPVFAIIASLFTKYIDKKYKEKI